MKIFFGQKHSFSVAKIRTFVGTISRFARGGGTGLLAERPGIFWDRPSPLWETSGALGKYQEFWENAEDYWRKVQNL